jgi:hypothetical protein
VVLPLEALQAPPPLDELLAVEVAEANELRLG